MILGAYGNFGRRLSARLARVPDLELLLAGRSGQKAEQLVATLRTGGASAHCTPLVIDAQSATLPAELKESGAQLLIHTGGPFQGQDYRVARACLAAGLHYIDLADGRDFVTGISQLDAEARAQDRVVISGASSVPGLSSAVMQALSADLAQVDRIDIAIAPGNRTERGEATVAAILSYVGKPSQIWQGGRWRTVYGWQNLHRHSFPAPVGRRWLAHCDVPDLSLFPEHYRGVQSVQFSAGLELSFLHLGLYGLSWLRRLGWVRDWSRHAGRLARMSRWFERFGSDSGGMVVTVAGRDHAQQVRCQQWQLLAGSGDGPFVPTIAAAVLAKKLASGAAMISGARPCLEQFTLAEFVAEARDLDIHFRCDERPTHD